MDKAVLAGQWEIVLDDQCFITMTIAWIVFDKDPQDSSDWIWLWLVFYGLMTAGVLHVLSGLSTILLTLPFRFRIFKIKRFCLIHACLCLYKPFPMLLVSCTLLLLNWTHLVIFFFWILLVFLFVSFRVITGVHPRTVFDWWDIGNLDLL